MNSVKFQTQTQMQNNEYAEIILATIRCLPSENLANIEIENSFSEGKLIKQKIKASYLTNVGKEPAVQQEAAIDAPMTMDELRGQEESKEAEAEEEPEADYNGSYEYEYPYEEEEKPEEPEAPEAEPEAEPEIKIEPQENMVVSFEEMDRPATRAQYGCKYCGQDCKKTHLLRHHIKYHHEVVWHKCTYLNCGYEAKMSSQVVMHIAAAHRSQYYTKTNKCLACRDFTSDTKSKLKYHVGICARVAEMELCQDVKV